MALPWETQLDLVAACIRHPEVARELHGVLGREHFETPDLGAIAEEGMALFTTYKQMPTEGQLSQVFSSNGRVGKEALKHMPTLFMLKPPPVEWAITTGRKLAADSRFEQLRSEMPLLVAEGSYSKIIRRARSAAVLASPRGETLSGAGTEEEILRRHQSHQLGERCPTDIPSLDKALRGGLKRGWLGQIYGMKGVGKTHACIHLACAGLRARYEVAYVTLETSADEVQVRSDLNLAGKPMEEFSSTDVAEVQELKSRFHVVDMTSRRASVGAVEAALDRLPRFPDLVVVDYATQLSGGSQGLTGDITHMRRADMDTVAKEMARLAARRRLFLWTPYQTNRGGAFKFEKHDSVVTVSDIAEGYSVSWHATGCWISLNQNLAEKPIGQGRIHVGDAKQGDSGFTIHCDFDWATSTIREIQ